MRLFSTSHSSRVWSRFCVVTAQLGWVGSLQLYLSVIFNLKSLCLLYTTWAASQSSAEGRFTLLLWRVAKNIIGFIPFGVRVLDMCSCLYLMVDLFCLHVFMYTISLFPKLLAL